MNFHEKINKMCVKCQSESLTQFFAGKGTIIGLSVKSSNYFDMPVILYK